MITKKMGKKNTRRIILLGDSHARGLAEELQNNLGKEYVVLGTVKPGSNLGVVANMMKSEVSALTKKDVCVIWGGTQDMVKNETGSGLQRLQEFVTDYNQMNLVVVSVPHRYNLQANSCVNNEVQVCNRKLKKVEKAFDHLNVIELDENWGFFTRHGLHLNGKGNELLGIKIASVIKDLLSKKKSDRIPMKWKEEEVLRSPQSRYGEKVTELRGINKDSIGEDKQGTNEQGTVDSKSSQHMESVPIRVCKVSVKEVFLWT
jgi:lysophospholipase L1-like esterase